VALAVLALALASCDAPGGSEESGEEDEIRRVLTDAMTTNDPAVCTTTATQRFLEQNLDERGPEAAEACRTEALVSEVVFAEELEFGEIHVEAAKAEATFDATGGAADGSAVTVELLKDEGEWKLDRFTDVQIDRDRFDRALYDTSIEEGATSREARCVVARTRRLSTTADLESEFLATDFRDIPDPTVLCLSKETLIRLFTEGFRKTIAADEEIDLPQPVLSCILNRFTERLSVPQLRVLLSAGDAVESTLEGLSGSAAKACVREYEAGVLGEKPQT
jgi:hypothetical protein